MSSASCRLGLLTICTFLLLSTLLYCEDLWITDWMALRFGSLPSISQSPYSLLDPVKLTSRQDAPPSDLKGKTIAGEAEGVALCVVGQIRTLYSSSNLNSLIQKLPLSAEVFAVLAPSAVLEEKLFEGQSKGWLQGFSFVNRTEILERLNAKRYLWYTGTEYSEIPRLNCTNHAYSRWTAIWWPQEQCLPLISEEETSRKRPYKFVVKVRPDIQLASPLHIQFDVLKSGLPAVVTPLVEYKGCIMCDQVAIMTRPAADAYFSVHSAYRACDLLGFDLEGRSCGPQGTCKSKLWKKTGDGDPMITNLECFWQRYMASQGVRHELSASAPKVTILSFVNRGQKMCHGGGGFKDSKLEKGSCWSGSGPVEIIVRSRCGV